MPETTDLGKTQVEKAANHLIAELRSEVQCLQAEVERLRRERDEARAALKKS